MNADELRQRILADVADYHRANWPEQAFKPGETPVPVAGRVFDAADVASLVDAALDFWLTTGRFADEFERTFAQQLGVSFAALCNSGSSANLLAVSALTSPRLGADALQPGDEILTVAAGFPTTVAPILQNRLVPVFLDIEPGTYAVDVGLLEEAVGPRTRAVMLAHTLGNPFNLDAVQEVVRKHNLWLIEDNCDALGSTYRSRLTGTFGALATASFYPAHHITMGEGGCVLGSRARLKPIVESFRDWGRDCWCDPGKDNTCGKRFDWQLGDLPTGYDHKYIYSHIGYNLKLTDMQAAVGVTQLRKLPGFTAARKRNWARLHAGLARFEEFFILPHASADSDPSWFGFALTIRPDAPFKRADMLRFLEEKRIATRLLFAGNLLRQPAFRDMPHRVVGDLASTDLVMHGTFWIGCYPGISDAMIDYVIEQFEHFLGSAAGSPR